MTFSSEGTAGGVIGAPDGLEGLDFNSCEVDSGALGAWFTLS